MRSWRRRLGTTSRLQGCCWSNRNYSWSPSAGSTVLSLFLLPLLCTWSWSFPTSLCPCLGFSISGLRLKQKLQYFGHLMQRANSLEKILTLGKIEGKRRGWQRMRWLDCITNSMDMSLSKTGSWWWTGNPSILQSMGSKRVGHGWVTELNYISWPAQMIVLLLPVHPMLDQSPPHLHSTEWLSLLITEPNQ